MEETQNELDLHLIPDLNNLVTEYIYPYLDGKKLQADLKQKIQDAENQALYETCKERYEKIVTIHLQVKDKIEKAFLDYNGDTYYVYVKDIPAMDDIDDRQTYQNIFGLGFIVKKILPDLGIALCFCVSSDAAHFLPDYKKPRNLFPEEEKWGLNLWNTACKKRENFIQQNIEKHKYKLCKVISNLFLSYPVTERCTHLVIKYSEFLGISEAEIYYFLKNSNFSITRIHPSKEGIVFIIQGFALK